MTVRYKVIIKVTIYVNNYIFCHYMAKSFKNVDCRTGGAYAVIIFGYKIVTLLRTAYVTFKKISYSLIVSGPFDLHCTDPAFRNLHTRIEGVVFFIVMIFTSPNGGTQFIVPGEPAILIDKPGT